MARQPVVDVHRQPSHGNQAPHLDSRAKFASSQAPANSADTESLRVASDASLRIDNRIVEDFLAETAPMASENLAPKKRIVRRADRLDKPLTLEDLLDPLPEPSDLRIKSRSQGNPYLGTRTNANQDEFQPINLRRDRSLAYHGPIIKVERRRAEGKDTKAAEVDRQIGAPPLLPASAAMEAVPEAKTKRWITQP